jgi:hypothetical protein
MIKHEINIGTNGVRDPQIHGADISGFVSKVRGGYCEQPGHSASL